MSTALDEEDTRALAGREVALIDILDRLLRGGVVLAGDLVLSIADVDLVRIDLRAVIAPVDAEHPAPPLP
ncbi:gas vesicle protein [Streptomyces sp. Rer75]|uniref:gas vesicle protein n=1 Tax=Streptomyces sp. Rer75 TaxID=2750011 RepID=UPI0015D00AE4|nr:gas vesicle protein [Streptomyces sp. Rer75]QLH25978.1 gas vesicle protein [Streptomyces sp. Rer75]